ncbi:MAG: DUF4351 domain-containing protein [Sandaracinaceae bacterium]
MAGGLLKKATEEGIEKGMKEGSAGLLLLMLQRRFDEVPQEMVERVRRGSPEEINRWAERFAAPDASLDEIFVSGARSGVAAGSPAC